MTDSALVGGPTIAFTLHTAVRILIPDRIIEKKGGSSSVAERQLPKLNVAGSIPVSRSIYGI